MDDDKLSYFLGFGLGIMVGTGASNLSFPAFPLMPLILALICIVIWAFAPRTKS